jgi:hypothetical protein
MKFFEVAVDVHDHDLAFAGQPIHNSGTAH